MPTFTYKDVWVSVICQSKKQEATEVSSDMEIAKQIVVAPSMEFHASIKTDVTENNFKTWKYSPYAVIFKILLQSSVNNFRQMIDGWIDRQNQTTPKFSSQNNQFILFLFHWLPEMTGLTKQFLYYSQFGEYYIPWRRKWHPLQYSRKFHGHFQKILENSMDRGAWQATVHRVSKSWTQLSNQTCTRTHTHTQRQPTHLAMPRTFSVLAQDIPYPGYSPESWTNWDSQSQTSCQRCTSKMTTMTLGDEIMGEMYFLLYHFSTFSTLYDMHMYVLKTKMKF